MAKVTLPQMGESVTEGTIIRWLKQEGEEIREDEPLVEISTDKIDTELPAPASGVLRRILVGPDETVEVGAEIAIIEEGGEAAAPQQAQAPQAEAPPPQQAQQAEQQQQPQQQAPAASAADREMAEQQASIDTPAEVEQSGVMPQAADVEAVSPRDRDQMAAREGAVETPEAVEGRPHEPEGRQAPEAGGAERRETPPARQAESGAGVLSPLVRKLAREHDVDLSRIRGTGTGGRITKDDVQAYVRDRDLRQMPPESGGAAPMEHGRVEPRRDAASAPAPEEMRDRAGRPLQAVPSREQVPERPPIAPERQRPQQAAPAARAEQPELPAGVQDVRFTRTRKAIAEHMHKSRQTAAHVTTVVEVDMTPIAELRRKAKGRFRDLEGINLTYLPFIAQATVQALRAFPEFNAHVLEDGETARVYREINLGIAVAREEGLIVPVVKGADSMNLTGLARAIYDVGTRAKRKGGLRPDDVQGGTFTITNNGVYGALIDTPIIAQPQVGILGTNQIMKRPAVVEVDGADAIAIRHMMFLALSYDHRWIDGHIAAQFVNRIKDILEAAEGFAAELGMGERAA